MADQNTVVPSDEDAELEIVYSHLSKIPNFQERAAVTIRNAVSEVLRGERTGRYSIEQLTRQEKAHIGTQVEIALLLEFFDLREGDLLDTTIEGIEIDIKNTIISNWMIPHEAIGQLCLLVAINENDKCFSIGVVRADLDILNRPNQDGKRSISAAGQKRIRWVVKKAILPVSIFLTIPKQVNDEIWAQAGNRSKRQGQARVTHLFRRVTDQPIFRSDIATLARQHDPAKRARDARRILRREGLLILSGRYHRKLAEQRGFRLRADEWISVTE